MKHSNCVRKIVAICYVLSLQSPSSASRRGAPLQQHSTNPGMLLPLRDPYNSPPVPSLPPPSPRKPFSLTQSLNRHRFAANYRYGGGVPGNDVIEESAQLPMRSGVQHSNTMPRNYGAYEQPPQQAPAVHGHAASDVTVVPNCPPPRVKTQPPNTKKSRMFASIGKGFLRLRSGKWASSAPNLGQS